MPSICEVEAKAKLVEAIWDPRPRAIEPKATRAGVKSWKGVETTSALQAQNHGEVKEMECLQAPSVFWTSCEHDGKGLRRPPKKGGGGLRRVRTKSKKHLVHAGTPSP